MGLSSLKFRIKTEILPCFYTKLILLLKAFMWIQTNKKISYQKGVYYRGIIKGQLQSVSAFNFFNGEFNGIISNSELGNIVVGKLNKPNNQSDYIVYSDDKMKVFNEFECHVKDDLSTALPQTNNAHRDGNSTNSTRVATMYFEIDNDLYLANGSDTTTTTNWMTSVLIMCKRYITMMVLRLA